MIPLSGHDSDRADLGLRNGSVVLVGVYVIADRRKDSALWKLRVGTDEKGIRSREPWLGSGSLRLLR